MQDRKYKYLYQLMLTSLVLVIIPVLFFYSVVWKRAIREVDYISNEYHINTLNYFWGYFTNEVADFRNKALEFSLKTRTSNQTDVAVFYQGTSLMKTNAYYYSEAAESISSFGTEIGFSNVGIYYYEKDILLAGHAKYSLDRYLQDKLELSDYGKQNAMDFFEAEMFENGRIVLVPLHDEDSVSEKCLVGVDTLIGKNKEKALIFYQLNSKNDYYLNLALQSVQSKYYIIDRKTSRLIWSVGASKEECDEITESLQLEALNENAGYYLKENENMDAYFILDVSEDSIQNKVADLYDNVRMFFAYILCVMLVICAAMVYFNYRPLAVVLKKTGFKGKGEFDSILTAWDTQNDQLLEQRMSILDLLMNHLLYGVPISYKYMEKLGVSKDIQKYCVFVIHDYVLKVSEMEELTKQAEELFGVMIFANDLSGESATVCIAFMTIDKAEELSEWVSAWCKSHISRAYRLCTGKTVDGLSEIQKSFAECMQEQSTDKETEVVKTENLSDKVRKRTVVNEKLKERILDYLDEEFTKTDLSQNKVADHFEISVYSLSKMFSNQIGTGFVEYVNSKRIEYAKELLLHTSKNVKEIANEAGFASSKYFAEIFKKYTGMTPGAFRIGGGTAENS